MTHARILLAGDTGSGKTAQFETMPGPRYAHIFDPAAHSTLSLKPGEYDNFYPLPGDLDLMPHTAIKGGSRRSDTVASKDGPQLYLRWAKRLQQQIDSGFFERIGSFMLDSATLLGLALMARQRWLGDKSGREDERQDHRQAGDTMVEALWTIMTLPCHVLVTMHTKYAEVKVGEQSTGERTNKLTVPGGSQIMLPRLVSACWYTSVIEDKQKGPRYMAMTRPQPRWPHARSPRHWGALPLWYDLTVEDWSCPQAYGVGALIARGE